MSQTIMEREILVELKNIKKDIEYIKTHMVNADTILTPEEEKRLDESIKAYKQGDVISLDEFEKEIRQ